jgi:peptidylprolyl isomerase
MRTAQQGDRAQVHYVIRGEDGSRASSRGRPPLDLTVGSPHPRLRGLGLALVGLAPGGRKTLVVPPEQAYGMPDPARVRVCSRKRFPENLTLRVGEQVWATYARGRRLVRILQIDGKRVLVDANHRWAGQTLKLEVELVALASGGEGLPTPAKAIAFDLDAASLAGLREALRGWEVESVNVASPATLARDWSPREASLLVVAVRADAAETWGLCRFLAGHASSPADESRGKGKESGLPGVLPGTHRSGDVTLLVLVTPERESLTEAALDAGAHRCLTLPLSRERVASVLAHSRAGNQEGRHTLITEQAQRRDHWRDDGGEG